VFSNRFTIQALSMGACSSGNNIFASLAAAGERRCGREAVARKKSATRWWRAQQSSNHTPCEILALVASRKVVGCCVFLAAPSFLDFACTGEISYFEVGASSKAAWGTISSSHRVAGGGGLLGSSGFPSEDVGRQTGKKFTSHERALIGPP